MTSRLRRLSQLAALPILAEVLTAASRSATLRELAGQAQRDPRSFARRLANPMTALGFVRQAGNEPSVRQLVGAGSAVLASALLRSCPSRAVERSAGRPRSSRWPDGSTPRLPTFHGCGYGQPRLQADQQGMSPASWSIVSMAARSVIFIAIGWLLIMVLLPAALVAAAGT